jgi:hypothetical protein
MQVRAPTAALTPGSGYAAARRTVAKADDVPVRLGQWGRIGTAFSRGAVRAVTSSNQHVVTRRRNPSGAPSSPNPHSIFFCGATVRR